MSERHPIDLAQLYHLASSHLRSRTIEAGPGGAPERLRTYPEAPRIALPGRDFALGESLGAVLARRRSVRSFTGAPLSLEVVGRLLHASFGVRGRRRSDGVGSWDRSAPSAGGLYPIELYVATRAVEGLADGIHHYEARGHALETVREGAVNEALVELSMDQEMVKAANLVCILTAVRARTMAKYGQRGYRFLFLDAGHVGQNLYLAATALGLGPVGIGGFLDRDLKDRMGLAEDEDPIYLVAVGQPAGEGM